MVPTVKRFFYHLLEGNTSTTLDLLSFSVPVIPKCSEIPCDKCDVSLGDGYIKARGA